MGKSRKEIKEKIMAKQVQIRKNEIPEGWSIEAADIINRLLQRKPANRLGLRGAVEIKDHAWLKYYPWKDLYDKKLESPFIPKVKFIKKINKKIRSETILMPSTVIPAIKWDKTPRKDMKQSSEGTIIRKV